MPTVMEEVKRSLEGQSSSLPWRRVTMPGLDVAWVGMNVPLIETGGRPWVWEVVTPAQYANSARLQEDPLVLPVAHDIVIAGIVREGIESPVVRMQVPVREAPEALSIPAGHPHTSWSVRLETGWSVGALAAAAQRWLDRETAGTVRLMTPAEPDTTHDLYQLHPAINIESAALDHLLTLGLDEAAVVTSLLSQVHEALRPYR